MEFYEALINSADKMRLSQLPVQFSRDSSCWVSLPHRLCSRLLETQARLPLVLQLQLIPSRDQLSQEPPSKRFWHVAWAGAASGGQWLGIPAALAGCVGIPAGVTVAVHTPPQPPAATMVTVEPQSPDDWEVVEAEAEYVEQQMLNQTGVVTRGEAFPFWVRNQRPILLTVSACAPGPSVRLVAGCEVAVAPRPRARPTNVLKPSAAEAAAAESAPRQPSQRAWLRAQAGGPDLLVDLPSLEVPSGSQSAKEESLEQQGWAAWPTACAFVAPETGSRMELPEGCIVSIGAGGTARETPVAVRWHAAAAPGHVLLAPPLMAQLGILEHRRVRLRSATALGLAGPASVELTGVKDGGGAVRLANSQAPDLQKLFTSWLKAQLPRIHEPSAIAPPIIPPPPQPASKAAVVQDGTLMAVQNSASGAELSCSVKLRRQGDQRAKKDDSCGAMLVSRDQIGSGILTVANGDPQRAPAKGDSGNGGAQTNGGPGSISGGSAGVAKSGVGGLHNGAGPAWQQNAARGSELRRPAGAASSKQLSAGWLHGNTMRAVLARLAPQLAYIPRCRLHASGAPIPGGLLICGPPGSGKSALAAALSQGLAAHPEFLTHVVMVPCREVAVEQLAAVKKQLAPAIREAAECAPSLLLLEDLHLLCPAPDGEPGEEAAGGPGPAALLDWLCGTLDTLRSEGLPVVVCGTCPEPGSLPARLRAPGRLDASASLPPPGPGQRAGMLEAGLRERGVAFAPQHLRAVAGEMEGYDASDLRALMDRAVHAAVQRRLAQPQAARPAALAGLLTVGEAEMAAARRGFSPASGWGVGRAAGGNSGPTGWQDVGGAADVCAAVREALEIPTRYARLTARAPLRLRTGVLLYGPPGCGKTHIVSAAVAAAGMNFVSVKGPQVLNKYIGASEAAVRTLFRRASAAAPCVLFFDEFDAIAPQRGHDSTGVTDRVVNQLLTELDGVEGLKGVVVLAATSRPDLLDAALLRPGRLDRLIYCGFPGPEDRAAVAAALARSLQMDPNAAAELRAVAVAAAEFSCADLGALLAEAQLAAVHEALEAGAAEGGEPLITAAHVRQAAAAARASVPAAERARLEAIYDRFRDSRDAGLRRAAEAKGKGKRATLA